ncbi:hypothetical protein [Mycobacteroides salmoniphilum]|uniref:hypothetical protein n=1 Tax=Mycobacteroides salmoniphilum TaxID=404941 RepID=UPI0012FFCB73|nr:hypothetical protein [Mycobacteroides salmoniphilum]
MPLHECAREALGGWPVGWPPSGLNRARLDGVHGLRVGVCGRVHRVARFDVRRAGWLCARVHGSAHAHQGGST